MGRHRSRAWGRKGTNGRSRGRIARVLPMRRLRLEALEDRLLLSLVGVPPLGGLGWITAATDEPAEAGTRTEIAFSGEAGVLTASPAAPDLLVESDSGVSDTDNVTNLDNSAPEKTLRFSVANTIAGATVTLYADGTALGSAVADSATTTITTNGNFDLADGPHAITARQTSPGEEGSADSAALKTTIDTVGPVLVNPVRLGGYDPVGTSLVCSVAVSGTVAYVTDAQTGLRIIDVSNPSAPWERGEYHTSGHARGVDISGTRAYVADQDAGLVIIDVTNPAAPVQVGVYDTSGDAEGVAVSGTRAYVADAYAGLVIIDVTDPAAPVRLGGYDTSGYARGVAVSGTRAYVADGGAGLQILDVTNPAAPVRLGSYDTGGSAYGVTVSGTRAYVADREAGLQILDVTNPAAPVRLGGYVTLQSAYDVAVSGTLAFVADGARGLVILDVSNPAIPVRLGEYDSEFAYGVAVSGTLVYVADASALQVFDVRLASLPAPDLQASSDTGISNTDNITSDNTPSFDLSMPVGYCFRFYRDGVQISGNYESGATYTTPAQADGTWAYTFATVDTAGNVSVPSPTLSVTVAVDTSILSVPDLLAVSDTGVSSTDNITNLDNSQPDKTLQFAVGNTIAGATVTLYADGAAIGSAVADGATTTVTTNGSFDLTDGTRAITARQTLPGEAESMDSAALKVTIDTVVPAFVNPVRLGSYDTSGQAYGVAVSGTLAYVADADAGLVIIDVSNPTAPVRLGGCKTSGGAFDVVVSGTLAYVVDTLSRPDAIAGLEIIDVSNPAAPVRLGGYVTSESACGVAISGTLAYVADGGAGLVIIDVSNPAAPVRLGGYNTSGTACGVAISGTLAYVADEYAGLVIIDVGNPATPVRLGEYDTSGAAYGVAVCGTVAYVGDFAAGLQIIDVGNPATPVRLGGYDTSGYARSVAVSGTVVYVADEYAGLEIIDVGNPATPVRLGGYETNGGAYDVAVSGTLAYVADGGAGLLIIDVSPSASPSALDLRGTSDTGVSSTDNITANNTPTFSPSIPAGFYFRVYRDGVQISGDYRSGAIYAAPVQADGTYGYSVAAVDAAGNMSNQSPSLAVTIDTQPPAVIDSTVNDGTAQRSRITSLAIRFNEDVSVSLDAGDLKLVNSASGAVVDLSGVMPVYDASTHTATWNLAGIALDDGYYTATLTAAGIGDVAGNPLAGGNYPIDFFRLLGDTDGNAAVDIFDVAKLQVNYGQTSGMMPADGDFDGNGTVDIVDVALLQVAYGRTLEPPAPVPAAAPVAADADTSWPLVAARGRTLSGKVQPVAEAVGGRASGPTVAFAERKATLDGATEADTQLFRFGFFRERDSRGEKAERPRKSRMSPPPMQPLAVQHAAENASWESAVDRLLESDE
ncbi:MAG: Ig-like domain-containing protein [Pirellulales bacterium]